MPLQQTTGNVTTDAYGGGVAAIPNYIEDVFSTYLYQANGSTQTITNGIDLSGKGGLVWIKSRSNATGNVLVDTVRGSPYVIQSNNTNAQGNWTNEFGSFSSTGFTVPYNTIYGETNYQTRTYASWTFRKQPKFFDVVTWTGSNDSGTSIGKGIVPHNLGSAPGCVIIKNVTQGATNWIVYHRSLSGGYRMLLNTTDAQTNSGSAAYFSKYVSGVGWTQTDPDANNIYVGYNYQTNGNGDTLVAYVFAHNAGGFGLTGTDNVISCGSYTGNGSNDGPTISLGYEPQWLLIKDSTTAKNWQIFDNMRGMVVGLYNSDSDDAALQPNLSNAESLLNGPRPNATGFSVGGSAQVNTNASTYIYIAIRRGPMKVPTSGTSVYNAIAYTGNDASNRQITGLGFPPDLALVKATTQVRNYGWEDRLRGADQWLVSSGTDSESSYSGLGAGGPLLQNGITVGANGLTNEAPNPYILQAMRRAPSFFDEVCYTGTGVATNFNHNLGVIPDLWIIKNRGTGSTYWHVGGYVFPTPTSDRVLLNDTLANISVANTWQTPTSTTFGIGTTYASNGQFNASGSTYVAYLFATCAGVSKVGSYTGNGTTQTINCGFTGGARFVLIKRTDSTGDWYVYDTARGMTVLTDPYLLMNSTAAETATLGSVTTVSTGFAVNASILAAINTNAASYIFLAIA